MKDYSICFWNLKGIFRYNCLSLDTLSSERYLSTIFCQSKFVKIGLFWSRKNSTPYLHRQCYITKIETELRIEIFIHSLITSFGILRLSSVLIVKYLLEINFIQIKSERLNKSISWEELSNLSIIRKSPLKKVEKWNIDVPNYFTFMSFLVTYHSLISTFSLHENIVQYVVAKSIHHRSISFFLVKWSIGKLNRLT